MAKMQQSVGLIQHNPRASFLGYTLFCNSNSGDTAQLIDMEGRICHRWQNVRGIRYAFLLDNGNLLCRSAPPSDFEGRQGFSGLTASVFELNWEGDVVWEYCDNGLHHDCERLPTGNTLLIKWEPLPAGLASRIQGGHRTDTVSDQMFGDVIIEVSSRAEVVRKGKSWEHLDPDIDVICPLEHRMEWSHCNSITLTPQGDWLLSFRRIDTVVIVDRETGQFTWKWGRGTLSHQHHATYLNNGNILLFDNGSHRVGPSYSQVLEVDPTTNQIAWAYKGNPILSFFSFMISGAERLPNGNTLICEGAKGHIFEVTAQKEIVWEYVNPIFASNPRFGDRVNFLFRAHRYGPDHPALRDKDLDPNRYARYNNLLYS